MDNKNNMKGGTVERMRVDEQIIFEEEKDDYIEWLEKLCSTLLVSKNTSNERIITKIREKDCYDDRFIKYFINKVDKAKDENRKRNKILKTLPLLKNYPISLFEDIYYEDEEAIFKWEKETIKKLLIKFDKEEREHGNICVSLEQYGDFFDKEIYPYKEWFFSDIYDRCLPERIYHFWGVRKDKNKSWTEDNVVISIISIIESRYLDLDTPLEYFDRFVGKED